MRGWMRKRGIWFVLITGTLFFLITGPAAGLLPACSGLHNITITRYAVNNPSAGPGEGTVLPAWIPGKAGSFQLEATNGIPPYHWAVKPGSQLPGQQYELGFHLSESGVISGTAPMLPPSETVRISPPFTVMAWDSDSPPSCDEETLSITFEQPAPTTPTVTPPPSLPTTVPTTATISPTPQETGTTPAATTTTPPARETPTPEASPPPPTTIPTTTAIQGQPSTSPGLFGGITSFFTNLVSGIFRDNNDPIIGTWEIIPANLTMRFNANGTAILRDPATGSTAAGRWEKTAEGEYRLYSSSGTPSPVLRYDPSGDALFTEDFSVVFTREA